jgi:hypothetical protein
MSNVRRWYLYIVSAISLQAVSWAVIALLRNLLVFGVEPLVVALQTAILIIGLPVYLGHWLSIQRSAMQTLEEKGSSVRRFYLYANLAGYLGPFLTNLLYWIVELMNREGHERLTLGKSTVYHFIALVVLGALWFYHDRIVKDDSKEIPEAGASATIRRLYVLGFSATGLIMTTLSLIHLVRWVMMGFRQHTIDEWGVFVGLTGDITRLIIGLPLWLIFWRWAQKLFEGPREEEHDSALRKFYLYGSVFIGAMGVVGNATVILSSALQSVLGLKPEGDIRGPLAVIVGMGILWAYHTFVLREDAEKAGEAPRQAGVRRLHLYLVAFVGLVALLIGLGGVISVILRSLGSVFNAPLREQLAWFTAAIIAGLPVWIVPWRKAQPAAEQAGPEGANERRSVVRKIYLYVFQFIAVMTMISSGVYIVYRIISTILGENPPTLSELGHAIAYSLIAAGLWWYHRQILRGDERLMLQDQAESLESLKAVVLDVGSANFGQAVVEALKAEIPGISLEPVILPWEGSEVDCTSSRIQPGAQNPGPLPGGRVAMGRRGPLGLRCPGEADRDCVQAGVRGRGGQVPPPIRCGSHHWHHPGCPHPAADAGIVNFWAVFRVVNL